MPCTLGSRITMWESFLQSDTKMRSARFITHIFGILILKGRRYACHNAYGFYIVYCIQHCTSQKVQREEPQSPSGRLADYAYAYAYAYSQVRIYAYPQSANGRREEGSCQRGHSYSGRQEACCSQARHLEAWCQKENHKGFLWRRRRFSQSLGKRERSSCSSPVADCRRTCSLQGVLHSWLFGWWWVLLWISKQTKREIRFAWLYM